MIANPQGAIPIACDTSALSAEAMQRWVQDIVPKVYRAVQEIQELPDGYAWRLPADSETLLLLMEDLNIERVCCPFVRYTLEIEPNHGPVWLRMTGGADVKTFLRMSYEEVNLFDEQVARAFGLHNATQAESVAVMQEAVDRINERFAAENSP